jgi:hypothetical protein
MDKKASPRVSKWENGRLFFWLLILFCVLLTFIRPDPVASVFRFVMYVFFGLSLEVIFSVVGIDRCLGFFLPTRVPVRYKEGFVSLYMIPLHGFGLLLLFEPVQYLLFLLSEDWWFVPVRFVVWAVLITMMEVLWGWFLEKALGFFTWDYYRRSKWAIFRGYTLWTLVPGWGVAGLVIGYYSDLLVAVSPVVTRFVCATFPF